MRTHRNITSFALGLALVSIPACDAPPPCRESGTPRDEAGECAIEWSCVDGAQRIVCVPSAISGGGSECSCYVGAVPQVVGDAEPRGFRSMHTPEIVCDLSEADRRLLASEGCGWNIDGR